jgi:hypothetical protein
MVLTAGPVGYSHRRDPPKHQRRPNLNERAWVLVCFPRAEPTEGTEGLNPMSSNQRDLPERKRRKFSRDRGSRRLAPAIDARRRLNERQANSSPTSSEPRAPTDPGSADRALPGLTPRGDASVRDGTNEGEFHREIVRRAQTARDRAAESLRRSRGRRKRQGELGAEAGTANRRRKFRRKS